MTALERWKVIYNHNVTWFQGRAGGEVEKGPMLVLECPTGHRLFLMHPAAKAGARWECPGCRRAHPLPTTAASD